MTFASMRPPPKSRGKPATQKSGGVIPPGFNEAPAEKQGKTAAELLDMPANTTLQ